MVIVLEVLSRFLPEDRLPRMAIQIPVLTLIVLVFGVLGVRRTAQGT